jgi:hypothetical protein
MDEMKKMDPGLKAKADVVKALKRMAMEMMAKDTGEDGALVAELEMKKVPKEEALEMLEGKTKGSEEDKGTEFEDSEDEQEMDVSEDDVSRLEKLIAAKKKMMS